MRRLQLLDRNEVIGEGWRRGLEQEGKEGKTIVAEHENKNQTVENGNYNS